MNNICKKTVVISIILLFVGVSVSSAIRVENKTPITDNQPPSPPDIDAPASIWVKEEVTICLYSVDPEGDNISYYIEWGDGTSDGWTDYITPGIGFAIKHKWDKVNWDNILRAKAKDIHGNESDWNSLPIPIFKSKDCGCNEVNDVDIVKLETQLDRLERYSKLLLVFSKYAPEIKDECDRLYNDISTLSVLDIDNEDICIILEQLDEILYNITKEVVILCYKYSNNPILGRIFMSIGITLAMIIFFYVVIGAVLDCWDFPPSPY